MLRTDKLTYEQAAVRLVVSIEEQLEQVRVTVLAGRYTHARTSDN